MGKSFNSYLIENSTEDINASKMYSFAIKDSIKVKPELVTQINSMGKTIFTNSIKDKNVINSLFSYFQCKENEINEELLNEENLSKFLSGTFVACGNVNNPQKSYYLELNPPNELMSDLLFRVLSEIGYPPKSSIRRGKIVLYYKDSEPIEDILTMIGASNCSLELMETKIYKDLRNRANRATNCETANIDKIIKKSQKQFNDINYLKEKNLLDTVPIPIKEIIKAREENPEASLSELSGILGISRSGINHRFEKLSKIVEGYKKS